MENRNKRIREIVFELNHLYECYEEGLLEIDEVNLVRRIIENTIPQTGSQAQKQSHKQQFRNANIN